MQALDSAFFHQVSRASRILVPRAWMAKSTRVVVPPMAAARVPVSKSSLEVVPPKGMSKCVCASMPPGNSSMPVASSTWWPGSAEMPGRTSLIVPASTSTSAAMVLSADTTVPFLMRIPIDQIFPSLARQVIFYALHRDAILHRTNQRAEITPYAFILIHARDSRRSALWRDAAVQLGNGSDGDSRAARRLKSGWFGMGTVHMNALMRAVPTGDVAQLAADALLLVNARHNLEIQVQMIPVGDLGRAQAAEILDAGEAFFAHPVLQAIDHVFHNAIAVMHGRGTHLYRATAQQNKFGRVAPGANAANAGNRQPRSIVVLKLMHHVQRDRLHRRAAITAVGGEPVDIRPGLQSIQIDAGDGVDGVDGRKPVGARPLSGARDLPDVGDVGCQLHQHRRARLFLHPARDHLGVLGHLTDGTAHAALAHSMRTTEVQLQAVGARVFGAPHNVVPGFARGLHHQRRDYRVPGVALLHLGDLAQIRFDGPVRNQLDIVQTHHALPVPIDRGITR